MAIDVRFSEPDGSPAPLCVLYLHGFGTDQEGEKAAFFRRAAVASGLAFCSFDFRGHGASSGEIVDLTLTRNLEDARAARAEARRRGHRRFLLLGSSMGGLTGLWHAALEPEAVAAGLYIAPALEMGRTFLDFLGPARAERWRQDGIHRFEDERGSCDLSWRFVEDFERYPWRALAERHRGPSLILQGELDDRVRWRTAAAFAEACGDAVELELYADGDHRLADRKERLWRRMLAFLADRGVL